MAASSPKSDGSSSFDLFVLLFTLNFSEAEESEVQDIFKEDADGLRELTNGEMRLYFDAIEEHEGFGDIPDLPPSYGIGMIGPINNLKLHEENFRELTGEAIKQYNNENGTNFEVVEITKANARSDCGILYFFTFEVKPIGSSADHPTTTFQAQVLDGITDIVVDLCRPKPKN